MFKGLSFFLKYFAAWLIFFFLTRLFFIIAFFNAAKKDGYLEIFKSFWYGLHMDASMTGYISVLPFLLYGILSLFNQEKKALKPIFIYSVIIVVLSSFAAITDVDIYHEWGTKFSYKALEFVITSPTEAMASSASSPLFINFSSIGFLIISGFLLFKYFVHKTSLKLAPAKFNIYLKTLTILLIYGFTFLAIRGGVGVAPMNTSKVYFSDNQVLNFAAINTDWYLMYSTLKSREVDDHKFDYFSDQELKEINKTLFYQPDTSLNQDILTVKSPNIIRIVMESFTADLVEELGGEKGITPGFSQLIKEGLLFNHIYATGDRTDKGIISLLSAFPAQGDKSIIKENEKQVNLPSLAKLMINKGYSTSFYYGGDTDFANFKAYILSHGYQKLIEKSDFNSSEIKSNWGAYDGYTFQEHIKFLAQQKEPFLSTLLTLTNHEPFQLPTKGKFGDKTLADKFRSTSYYVDQELIKYIIEAKKQDWYKNTIFIITADHGHRLPKETREIYDPLRYHIPLLIIGGALKEEYKGTVNQTYGSQVDVNATILAQIGINNTDFKYSKNLLNPKTKGYGFYNWDNGFGYVDKNMAISFDPINDKKIYQQYNNELTTTQKDSALIYAKALMQHVYKDYINY
jgi:phosphoglycerol transferase MdoB-like AlkP superfamily enzyme